MKKESSVLGVLGLNLGFDVRLVFQVKCTKRELLSEIS